MRFNIRRLSSVGALMAIPVAALIVIGSGVAGATTYTLSSPSYAQLPGLGKITLAGSSMKLVTGTRETYTATNQPIVTAGLAHEKATVVATVTRKTSGNRITMTPNSVTLSGTVATGCVISHISPVTLNLSSGSFTGTKTVGLPTYSSQCTTIVKNEVTDQKVRISITL